MKPVRFAAAAYSNSAPLVACLSQVDPNVEVFHGVPSMHLKELLKIFYKPGDVKIY